MEKSLEYSFDDEPVRKFCYDLDNKIMEIHFSGYYDLNKDEYRAKTCIWMLEGWEYAKSRLGDDQKFEDLSKHLGIFQLILYMKFNNDKELEMLVNTIDNKYVTIYFKNPRLSLK